MKLDPELPAHIIARLPFLFERVARHENLNRGEKLTQEK